MYQPAMSDTANYASTRRQARTDGGGGEKESSVPELCSLESVCGQVYVSAILPGVSLPPYLSTFNGEGSNFYECNFTYMYFEYASYDLG